jgi:hypothetical protein
MAFPRTSSLMFILQFDLEDLVFRLINAQRFIERTKEQDEIMQDREEFRKRVLRK